MRNKLSKLALAATLVAVLFTSQAAFAANKVHLNQIGFGATAQKQAVYNGASPGTITIRSIGGGTVNQAITPGASKTWTHSGEAANRILDFSSVTTPGYYALYENGSQISPIFQIGVNYDKLTRDALRFYYYHRADLAIVAPYAETFTRAAGHGSRNATIYNAAGISTGTTITSYRGWYDAGDYGRYVANSGISVYTLLALYEKYHDKIPDLNIPADAVISTLPALLSEIKWNLDWMLTMQASDGGVYHKMTTQDFPNLSIAPNYDTDPLMVMWKTTAATLDFAAVMAVASRIYKPFNSAYATQMLTAAENAWTWAKNNPNTCYNRADYPSGCAVKSNDPTRTGPYEDDDVDDEFFFAAVALATVTDASQQNTLGLPAKITQYLNQNFGTASWQNVGTLGKYEIIRNKTKLSTYYNAAKTVLTSTASTALTNMNSYGLPFDNLFWWGSNSDIGNLGILFMELYEDTGDVRYKNAAQATFDYILGRNPIDQSYVTGYGNKSPQHPHDRLTIGAYSRRVFPGQVVGGAASGCYDDDKNHAGATLTTPLAARYIDDEDCPAWNEIAINWNAPVAYLSAALSEAGSDIGKIEMVTQIDHFADGSSAGITGDESWYNFIVGTGNSTASISNENNVLSTGPEYYAELKNIALSQMNWSNPNNGWAQATIALETTNNGTLYDLAQCSDGFRYKYKGNHHRFSLESTFGNKSVTHFKDIYHSDCPDNYTCSWGTINSMTIDTWTEVTVNSYERDPYDEAYGSNPDIPLDLSKVESIRWTVRPINDQSATSGYLQIKDFECLGLLNVKGAFPPSLTVTYKPTLKLSDVFLPDEDYTWDYPNTSLSVANSGQSFAATYTSGSINVHGNIVVIVEAVKITKPTVTNTSLVYTGSPQSAGIAANAAYTVTNSSEINAGSYTATVVLKDKANYEWTDGSTTDLSLPWAIAKATGLIATNPSKLMISYTNVNPNTFDLSTIAKNKTDHDTLSYTKGTFTDGSSILTADPVLSGTTLTYTGTGKSNGTATQVINIISLNYADASVTLTFEATNKTQVTISGLTVQNSTYNGTAQRGVTGDATSGAYSGALVYTYAGMGIEGTSQPINAGDYTLTVSVPDADATYFGSAIYTFSIAKAKITKPTVTATSLVYTGSQQSAGIAANAAYTITNGSATNAGSYTATVALTDKANHEWTDGSTTDLSLPWAIGKASPAYTLPTGLTATAGQNLAAVLLPAGWTWANPATPVGAEGTQIHKANFTPTDALNYNVLTNIDVSITVNAGTPILPQIAVGSIRVQAISNAIVLQNLPKNAKVEVYNLQGKRIYSTTNHSPLTTNHLKIEVQTKGMYIVKVSLGSEAKILRMAVR